MRIYGLIPCGVGVVFLLVFTVLYLSQSRKHRVCTGEAAGTVADYLYKSVNGEQRTWRPVFEYHVAGKTIRKQSMFGTTEKRFQVGQAVTVRYNPENPQEYYVEELESGGQLQKIFLLVGITLLFLGLILLFLPVRRFVQ